MQNKSVSAYIMYVAFFSESLKMLTMRNFSDLNFIEEGGSIVLSFLNFPNLTSGTLLITIVHVSIRKLIMWGTRMNIPNHKSLFVTMNAPIEAPTSKSPTFPGSIFAGYEVEWESL